MTHELEQFEEPFVIIEVDDFCHEGRPRTIFHYPNGLTQTYDIIATVMQNATSIAHPSVLFAIRHWETTVRLKNALLQHDAYERMVVTFKTDKTDETEKTDPLVLEFNYLCREDDYRRAVRNLEAVGSALLNGAKSRQVTKDIAINIYMAAHGLSNLEDTYLYVAWRALKSLKTIRNSAEKLMRLEEELRKTMVVRQAGVSVNRVLSFFKSEQGRPFLSIRRSWVATRSAFLAQQLPTGLSRGGSSSDRLRRYRSSAKGQDDGIRMRGIWGGRKYHIQDMAIAEILAERGILEVNQQIENPKFVNALRSEKEAASAANKQYGTPIPSDESLSVKVAESIPPKITAYETVLPRETQSRVNDIHRRLKSIPAVRLDSEASE